MSVYCMWYLGSMTQSGKYDQITWGLAPTSQSSSKNRVTRISPVDLCFFVCLRMKRTEEELVKILDMKDRGFAMQRIVQ